MINRPTGGTTSRGGGNNKNGSGRPPAPAATRRAGQSPQEFVRGVVLEMRRVTWPSREEWISATILTIALVVGIGLFTWLVDQFFGFVFDHVRLVG